MFDNYFFDFLEFFEIFNMNSSEDIPVDLILRNYRKSPFLPNLGKKGLFPKNCAPSLFYLSGPLTSCKRLEKCNGSILGKVRCGLTK